MSRAVRLLLITLAIGAALIIISLISFVTWSRANIQSVIGAVTISGTPLEGLETAEVEAVLAEVESREGARQLEILIGDHSSTITAAEAGYTINADALLTAALERGREGGFLDRWRRWLRNLVADETPIELYPESRVSSVHIQGLLDRLDQEYGFPPTEGDLVFIDGRPVPSYPAPGSLLDRAQAGDQIRDAVLGGAAAVRLNTVPVAPATTSLQIEEALAEAQMWVSAPVVFTDPARDVELVFTASEIAEATVFEFHPQSSPSLVLTIDRRLVTRKVAEITDRVGDPPVDAFYEINENDQVIIHPSQPGTVLDVEAVGDSLEALAAGADRQALLPIVDGVEARVTTEDIEQLGIRHLLSSYTTFHPCCAARVTNIQLFADRVNDAMVSPGETFSLNGHVGRRTREDGFVEAGTLIRGELIDTVGGGVSQFATTFYNAVFWAGFEDITRKTHSFYFPRYPEGIEATINWPEVDLTFRNDLDGNILIRTEYTDTSITVKIFGSNDGRVMVGSWRNGRGHLEVVSEGGPQARWVTARISDRFDRMEPPETLYRANPELAPDEVDQLQTAEEGWAVRVTRIITQGEDAKEQSRIVRYIPRQEIIEVHPCVMTRLTDSGAVIVEADETAEQEVAPAEGIVCPGPQEEPTELPEGLHDRFPELAPEQGEQAPIDDEGEGGEQTPIGDGENGGDQAPIEDEESQSEDSQDPEETDEDDQ